jgi:hypothetical protein
MPDRTPSLAEAEAALEAARATLPQEEAKLGQARQALGASERELERLGDVLAAGAPDPIRKAASGLAQTIEVQRAVTAGCSRRVEQARAKVAACGGSLTAWYGEARPREVLAAAQAVAWRAMARDPRVREVLTAIGTDPYAIAALGEHGLARSGR